MMAAALAAARAVGSVGGTVFGTHDLWLFVLSGWHWLTIDSGRAGTRLSATGAGYANVRPEKCGETPLKALLAIIGWCLLLVLCWPLAVLAIVLWPLLWLVSLPFRLVGITFDALFALLRAILFLPARLLGHRDSTVGRSS
jgi:hypothetical protein